MNNATTILLSGLGYGLWMGQGWMGFAIGLVVGLLSCLLVDAIWWLIRKLA